MRLFSAIFIFLFCLLAKTAADTPEAAPLRFDGVYQAHPGGHQQSLYLRFYADEYVVAMSFGGTPEEVADLISRGYSALPQGKFVRSGSQISFTTKAQRGEIDYVGIISADGSIQFNMRSRITKYEAGERFVFQKVKFIDDGESTKRLTSR